MTKFEIYALAAIKAGATFHQNQLIAKDTSDWNAAWVMLEVEQNVFTHERSIHAYLRKSKKHWTLNTPDDPLRWFDRRSLNLLPRKISDL